MTTHVPVLDLVGDIGHFALVVYGGVVWTVYLRETGALELHRSGDAIDSFLDIDVPYPKAQVTAAVLGSELCLAWVQRNTGEIYFSRYDLARREYVLAPTLLWSGRSPSLAVYRTDKLIASYRNGGQQHVFRMSADLGATWSSPTRVADDVSPVDEVDVNIYPASDNMAYWAETADESV